MDMDMLIDMFRRMTKYDLQEFATKAIDDGIGETIEFNLGVAKMEKLNGPN